jgi:hypothetical protein
MTCALNPARMRRPKRVDYTSHDDETDDLRWLTEASLIFDRVSDELFNIGAGIRTVPVSSK